MTNDDVVIVGGGLAGLFCALKMAPRPVTLVTAAPIGEGAASAWAQGGIAAAVADGDSAEAHTADTMAAGAGIVDEAVALSMAREAGDRVRDLLQFGVPFDRDLEGRLVLSREAAHGARRIVRVGGDMAGHAIMSALVAAVRATPSIRLVEGFSVQELLVDGANVCGLTVRAVDRDASIAGMRLTARAVVLATGGAGGLYAVTTDPPQARGQGLAVAARAGALVSDVEFVQFHPTAIDVGLDPAPLATEALRGEGATLIDRNGRRFMPDAHPDAELAPRDVVARAVFRQIAAGAGAFLDCREAIGAAFAERFAKVYEACRGAGIDPVVEPIPVAPAAHYHMGGIMVDGRGRSSIDGLWACGEVSATGAHGANRLASNSLLEAVVYAARIANDVAGQHPAPTPVPPPVVAHDGDGPDLFDDAATISRLRGIMSERVGVVRDRVGLIEGLSQIDAVEREGGLSQDFRNMVVAARLIAAAALEREESRGAHFRSDCPKPDPARARRSVTTLARSTGFVRNVLSKEAHADVRFA